MAQFGATEPCINASVGRCVQKVPGLRFWFPFQQLAEVRRRVHLNGKSVRGVENFEQKREPFGWVRVGGFAEDGLTMVFPEIIQRGAEVRTVVNARLIVGAVTEFPRFPDGLLVGGDFSPETGGDPCSSPDSGFEDWRERERVVEGWGDGHFVERV